MSTDDVAVVIINWNGLRDTLACLDSVLNSRNAKSRVFVVDNGSQRDEAGAIEEKFGRDIKVIRSPRNLGFAGGANLGIREAMAAHRPRFLVTLNNDTLVADDWLNEIIREATASGAEMVASKMFFLEQPGVLNSTGFLVLRDGTAIDRGRHEKDQGQYDQDRNIFGPSAGAALYSADLLSRVGLFDEDFFAYFEDVDLAWRGRLAGARASFASASVVRHKHSASSGPYSLFKVYQGERNRIWLALKNFPAGDALAVPLFSFVKTVGLAVGAATSQGRAPRYVEASSFWAVARTLARAKLDAIRGFRTMAKKRRAQHALVRVDGSEIQRWFRELSLPVLEAPYK